MTICPSGVSVAPLGVVVHSVACGVTHALSSRLWSTFIHCACSPKLTGVGALGVVGGTVGTVGATVAGVGVIAGATHAIGALVTSAFLASTAVAFGLVFCSSCLFSANADSVGILFE